ncbi:MAG: nitrophenyl compound nitroreductase subunit ArsF family protein [Flavobacteriales bacterium]|nr:nitrophenyl compound nitroreductase subunit ArsF family protein [Flavobacteriales bacterium]
MKTNQIIFSLAAMVIMLFTACSTEAQNTEQSDAPASVSGIEVIQFHSEHRCMTCTKIEKLSKETLESYTGVPFKLVNVDDSKNEAKAEEFEAFGTALFLYNPETGKKKELTEFAFMNAHDEEKFKEGLREEIDQFGN